jgi:NDP-sugar pyrophosphorylase family protein
VKALILAAGLGTRLQHLTRTQPKPMLRVAGRPLLEHTIGLLRSHGVRDIAMNLHYQPEAIIRYFGDGATSDVNLFYSFEDRLLGTAGAAKRLETFLDRSFYVIYGDVLSDLNLTELAARHHASKAALSLALYHVDDPTRAGIVEVDAGGRVCKFVEKPAQAEVFSDAANAGIFVVEPGVLDCIPRDTFFDFGLDVIPRLLRSGARVCAWPAEAYVMDIGSPERYRQARADVRAGRVRIWRARNANAA